MLRQFIKLQSSKMNHKYISQKSRCLKFKKDFPVEVLPWQGIILANLHSIKQYSVSYPEFFWADWYIDRSEEDTTIVGTEQVNFQNFFLQIPLKMHSPSLSVLRFLCKTFFNLLKFTLWNTLLCEWFLKNSYIPKKVWL